MRNAYSNQMIFCNVLIYKTIYNVNFLFGLEASHVTVYYQIGILKQK